MEPSFIINVGSYEKALYGYDAMFNPNYAAQQKLKAKGKMKDEAEEFKFLMRPIYAYMPHIGCIKVLASNEKYLASASTDEMIKLYDLTKRTEVGTLTQHEGMVTAMQFWKNKYLFTSSMDGTVCVWVTKEWDIVQILKHKAPILAMAVHPTGKLCLTAGNDKKMKLWDLQSGNAVTTMPLEHDPDLVMWSPAGESYAVLVNQQVLVYSAKTGKIINTLKETKRIQTIAYLSEKVLATGGENRQINVWQIYEGSTLHVLTGFENRIKNLFAIDKMDAQKQKDAKYPYLVSTSSDCSVKIWDLDESTTESVAETYIDDSRITCLTCSYVVDMQAKEKGEEESSDLSEEESVEHKPKQNPKKRKRDHFVVVEQEKADEEDEADEDDENSADLDDEDLDSEMEGQVFDAKDVPELLADELDGGDDEVDDEEDNEDEEDDEEEEIEQPKKMQKKVKEFDVKKQNKANNKQNKQNNKAKKQQKTNTTQNKKTEKPDPVQKPAVQKPAAPKPAAKQPQNTKQNNNQKPKTNAKPAAKPIKGILKKK